MNLAHRPLSSLMHRDAIVNTFTDYYAMATVEQSNWKRSKIHTRQSVLYSVFGFVGCVDGKTLGKTNNRITENTNDWNRFHRLRCEIQTEWKLNNISFRDSYNNGGAMLTNTERNQRGDDDDNDDYDDEIAWINIHKTFLSLPVCEQSLEYEQMCDYTK